MRVKLHGLIAAAAVVAQLGISVHGYAQWRESQNAPVRVAAGWVATREMPNGSWKPLVSGEDLRAGDRLQLSLRTVDPADLVVLHIEADGDVRRLHPPPGGVVETTEPDTYYALPSPTTWYAIDHIEHGDRLVVVAARPGSGKDWVGELSSSDLETVRARLETGRPTGHSELFDVPLPDGGRQKIRLQEMEGRRTVWIEWALASE